jgi:hypothetical protein
LVNATNFKLLFLDLIIGKGELWLITYSFKFMKLVFSLALTALERFTRTNQGFCRSFILALLIGGNDIEHNTDIIIRMDRII